jgi:hypothetical protein
MGPFPGKRSRDDRAPEKRKVGSSTLPLTTSFNQEISLRPAETQRSEVVPPSVHARLRPLVTVARHRMLHVDCTTHGSGVSRSRCYLAAPAAPHVCAWSTSGPWSAVVDELHALVVCSCGLTTKLALTCAFSSR